MRQLSLLLMLFFVGCQTLRIDVDKDVLNETLDSITIVYNVKAINSVKKHPLIINDTLTINKKNTSRVYDSITSIIWMQNISKEDSIMFWNEFTIEQDTWERLDTFKIKGLSYRKYKRSL